MGDEEHVMDAFDKASDAVKTAALAIAMDESRVNVLSRDVQLAERVVSALDYETLREERAELLDMVDRFLEHYAGTHERGEEIDSGYGIRTLCTEDEPCRLASYWPCPTERLRRARSSLETARIAERET